MGAFEPVRGICFDLWNTLAFTDFRPHPIEALASAFGLADEPGWRRIIERAMMTRRLTGITEAIESITTLTGRKIAERGARRDLVLLWGEANTRNRIFPDVLPALSSLRLARGGRRGYKLGLLSNTQSFDLDFIRREGLDLLLDDMCLSCDCGLLKPDPAIYDLASRRMGLPPEEILMIGDSRPDDVEGARAAGLAALLLDRAGKREEGIRDLSQIVGILTAS